MRDILFGMTQIPTTFAGQGRLAPDAATSVPAVELSGLTKSFGSVRAVRGLDLTVAPGEIVAFLGPNGAGKTTTIDMMLGLSRPDSGSAQASPCDPLSSVQKRVVAKAQVGVEALRDYVYITRGVWQLSMIDVTKNIDRWLNDAHCAGMAIDEAAVRQNVALAAKMPALR